LSSFESDAAAAEALAATHVEVTPAPAPVSTEQAPAPASAEPAVEAGTPTSESFTAIDATSLPPELQEQYRNLQADYTRKMQEAAPYRKALEERGLSTEQAQQALDFVASLQDPAVQRQLYDELSGRLDTPDPGTEEDPYEDGVVDPRDRQMQELQDRLDRFEQAQTMARVQAQVEAETSAIRQANPDFKDADIQRIQRLAISFDGDLTKATEEFKGWRQEVLSGYVDSKGTVVAGAAPPAVGTHAETPGSFANLDEASKAAMTRFGNDWT
jgi:hypothetical protein